MRRLDSRSAYYVTYYRHDVHCMFCAGLRDKSKDKAAAAAACVPSQFPCVRLIVLYDLPVKPPLGGKSTVSAGTTSSASTPGTTTGTSTEDQPGSAVEEQPAAVAVAVQQVGFGQEKVQHREAIMHPDSLQATGPYSQCSFSVCLRNGDESRKAVELYVEEWRAKKHSRFPCYYDTVSLDAVIVQKMYSTADVVHSMLWPSLVVLGCGAIFLRLEMRRRRLTLCGRRASVNADGDVMPVMGPVGSGGGGLYRTNHAAAAGLTGSGTGSFGYEDGEKRPMASGIGGDHVVMGRGCRLAAAAARGRPAIVYKSLPSLVIPLTENNTSTERGNGGGGGATGQGHHHHRHHHQPQLQQASVDLPSGAGDFDADSMIPLKETLARKLSASVDRFDASGKPLPADESKT